MRSQAGERPNIVLLHCHDLGRFLGCYGVPTVSSPNLDRLAAEGVRFDAMFATAPQCSPSRASLFTGRWPHSNGVMGLTHADFGWDLYEGERHLAAELAGAGYETSAIGVLHEARDANGLGFGRVGPGGDAERVADLATAELKRMVAGGRPFYLQVGFFEPHRQLPEGKADFLGFLGKAFGPDAEKGMSVPPYLVDDEGARAEVAELQGAIAYVDTHIGRILGSLSDLGAAEETIVVFTTDHGVAFPRAKCSLYDPGIEIAFVVRCPARGWSGGRVETSLVSNLDVHPTLLDVLGLPPGQSVQGQSFLDLLDAGAERRERSEVFGELTYHDYYNPMRCLRTATHKLIVNFASAPAFMDPSQSWRPRTVTREPSMPHLAYHPVVELYDLVADPGESRNLAEDEGSAAIRQELLARLLRWLQETSDPILGGAVTSPIHHRALDVLRSAAVGGTRP